MTELELQVAEHAGFVTVAYGVIVVLGLLADLLILLALRRGQVRWEGRLARLQWRPWGLRELVVLLAFMIALQTGAVLLPVDVTGLAAALGVQEDTVAIFLQSLVVHWCGLAMIAAWQAARRMPWSAAFGMDTRAPVQRLALGLLFILATMPPLLFYTAIYHAGLNFFQEPVQPQDIADAFSRETSLLARGYFVVLAVFIAPLFEELFFRGIMLPALAKRFSVGWSVVMVSALFASIHGHLPSLLPLFLLSVALCLAYVYAESLWVPMVMHGCFNGLTVSFILWTSA